MELESDLSDASPMLPLKPAVNFSRLSNRLPPPEPKPTLVPAQKTVVFTAKRMSAPSMLRVTPVPIPSLPAVNRKVQSLLTDAKVSHYNYQMASYRIPHKYDHFHVKTFEINFVPTFNFDRFERKGFSGSEDQTENLTRAMNKMKEYHMTSPKEKKRRTRRCFRSSQSPPVVSKRASLPRSPINATRSQSPIRSEIPKHTKAVVCVQDGSSLDSPDLRSVVIDLQLYFDKYIGFSLRHGSEEEERSISLATHGLMEVMEAGTKALKPDHAFTALYTVDGVEILEISQIPEDCQAIVFGWKQGFLGLV